MSTYDETRNGWVNIPSSADQYPHAPWWSFATAKASSEWGNPSAEILGCLLKYAPNTDSELLQRLSHQALRRLDEISIPEPHEIKCYIRLYESADQRLQKQLYDPLAKHIVKVANKNLEDWRGYVPTPLTFITSPDSPFTSLFDRELLLKNAQFLQDQIIEDNHWEPNWEWGQFEDDWVKAKQDWSGKITVDNLKILEAFDIVTL